MKNRHIAIGALALMMAWTLSSPALKAAELDDTPTSSRVLKLSIHFGGKTWQMILGRLAISLLVIQQPPTEDPPLPPDDDIVAPTDAPTDATAEVANDDELLMEEETSSDEPPKSVAKVLRSPTPLSEVTKLLPSDCPEWVGHEVDVSGKDHFVSVGGIPSETFELSKESLRDGIVLNNARDYLNRYVLEGVGNAEQISQIDTDFVMKRWLVRNREYDAKVEMSTGSYHMAWVQLKIPERDRKQVIEWIRDVEREERLRQAAGLSVAGFLTLGMVHLAVGFVARRKKT